METKFDLVPNPQEVNLNQVLSTWCLFCKKLSCKEVNLIEQKQTMNVKIFSIHFCTNDDVEESITTFK